MKKRIQLNGVWYVREDYSTKQEADFLFDETDVTESEQACFENDDYCFEATRIRIDNNSFYPGLDIKYTDKTVDKRCYIYNSAWFLGILNDNEESLEEAREVMDEDAISILKQFLQFLRTKRNWII